MARKQIVILGGGTGGTMTANRLRRRFDLDEAEIHVVDRDDGHVYQPGLLFVPFGMAQLDEIVRPRRRQLRDGVVFHEREIDSVSIDRDEVTLDDGTVLPYDVLVVASGARLQPEETEGLTAAGWNEKVFTFYEPESANALRGALEHFDGGRLLVNLVDMPIKCPVAPLEFAFLADWFLSGAWRARPHRDRVRDASRQRVHQEDVRRPPVRAAHRQGDRARDRVQRRRGGRDRREAHVVRRPRAGLRPARHRAAPRRSGLRRALTGPRRRAGLRADGHGDAPDGGQAERLRARRRDRPAYVEGGLRHPLRGRGAGREHRALLRRTRSSRRATTATRTASSRPAFTRRCSSTSTTTSSRCPGTSRPLSDCRSCASRASTTGGSCCSSGSTGTRCCPVATSRASGRRCRRAGSAFPLTPERRSR